MPKSDDVPKAQFFDHPLTVDRIKVLEAEDRGDGRWAVTFRARIRDASGKRCPELAVYVHIDGPERVADGMGTTDLLGQVAFQTEGPAGTYVLTIDDVAGGTMPVDEAASVMTATAQAG